MTKSTSITTPTFATIEELKSGELTVVDHYQLNWENCLLITRYQDQQTFVLLADGLRIVIDKPFREVLADFGRENCCFRRCIEPYYDMLYKSVQIKAMVLGENLLVPSMGFKNNDVVYYMSRYVESHSFSKKRQAMLLNFAIHDFRCHIWVPAYPNKFENILTTADYVSHLQIKVVESTKLIHGFPQDADHKDNFFHARSKLLKGFSAIIYKTVEWALDQFLEEKFGIRCTDEDRESLRLILSSTVKR